MNPYTATSTVAGIVAALDRNDAADWRYLLDDPDDYPALLGAALGLLHAARRELADATGEHVDDWAVNQSLAALTGLDDNEPRIDSEFDEREPW